MSCASEYAPQLRSRGYRITPQRMAILHVLRHSGEHLSPRDVYQKAKKDFPRLTEPTVYRTLEFLVRNGLARPAQAGNGRLRYQLATGDHHHIVCRGCGDEIEVDVSPEKDKLVFRALSGTKAKGKCQRSGSLGRWRCSATW